MPISKECRKYRLAPVVVPGAGLAINAAGIAVIPRKISQNDFSYRRAGNLRGFYRSQIARLWPGPICGSPDMLNTIGVEPESHVVADAIGVPAGFDVRILRIAMIGWTVEDAKSIGDVLIQGPIGLINLAAVWSDRRIAWICGLKRGSLPAVSYPPEPNGVVISVIFRVHE